MKKKIPDSQQMAEIQYLRPGEIRCWACKSWMSNNEFQNADGFCIYCDVEIDDNDSPYRKGKEDV